MAYGVPAEAEGLIIPTELGLAWRITLQSVVHKFHEHLLACSFVCVQSDNSNFIDRIGAKTRSAFRQNFPASSAKPSAFLTWAG
jgi:hypothetical protein